LIEIGSKTVEKNSAQSNRQTNKQTDRHYNNNGHLAVNQLVLRKSKKKIMPLICGFLFSDIRSLENFLWNC